MTECKHMWIKVKLELFDNFKLHSRFLDTH